MSYLERLAAAEKLVKDAETEYGGGYPTQNNLLKRQGKEVTIALKLQKLL